MSSESVTYDIRIEGTDRSRAQLHELRQQLDDVDRLLSQTMLLMRRMGLGENITGAFFRIQQIITAVNGLRAAVYALQVGAGPIGWMMLGIAGLSMATVLQPNLLVSEMRSESEAVRTH